MRVAAIILSGGKGLRAGTKIPKQYIEIKEKPILGYTIDAFEQSRVDEIIIVAADEYLGKCREIAAQCADRKDTSRCGSSIAADRCASSKVTAVIGGGEERYDSVLNGLRYLAERSASAPEIVLIHDGARPFIRPAVIDEIIRSVEEGTAAIAAAPCTDTIKIADENGFIVSTTERARTWAAQTPQAFRTEEICEAYETIIGSKSACGSSSDGGRTCSLAGITDDAMVYQMAFPGRPVRLISAGPENFKITTAEDLTRAESLLR